MEKSAPADSPETAAALRRALAEGWRELELLVECQDPGGRLERLEIFGSGAGILNRERQFRLSKEAVAATLEALRDQSFATMAEIYGKGGAGAPVEQGVRVTCRIVLQLDGTIKQVAQRARGYQSPELKRLAHGLLDRFREAAAKGVAAESLADGLRKVAAGELAPETLELVLNYRPGEADRGWLLRIGGGRVSTRSYLAGRGYGEPVERALGERELALIEVLAKQQIGELPVNLWAEHYTDLVVRVLGREHRLQARPFDGMEPSSLGEQQERFERAFAGLSDLHRSLVDGREAGG